MQGTFEVAKDPKVAFEIMAPVYWDPVRQHATAFIPGAGMIGRAKFTSCVNDTKLDVIADVPVCVDQRQRQFDASQTSVYVALDDAKRAFERSMQQMQDLKHERDRLKSRVLALHANISSVSAERDEAKASLSASETRWRDVMKTLSKRNTECNSLRLEMEKTHAELAKLRAERDHFRALSDAQAGDPRDNGDGTVTATLPVTYPKGLPVECVRGLREGDRYVECDGDVFDCQNSDDETSPGQVWLILRPAPKPPEPVTWKADLADGMWHATNGGALAILGNGQQLLRWEFAETYLREVRRPSVLGRYLFKDGVGTLIECFDQQRDDGGAPAS